MAAFMPAWRPLDATHSVRLLSERPRGGRVVALCVSPGLAGRPEGARLAVSLARRWTEGGVALVLADGDLARPILHLTLGLTNVRGLTEILLAGEEWASLALSTSVPGLRLIPAGGSAAPAGSQAARDRLADLSHQVHEAGSALVVYVPLGTMLAEWTLEVCTDVVVLSGEGESVSSLFEEDEDRIRANVGPAHLQHRPLEPAQPARVSEPTTEPRSPLPAVEYLQPAPHPAPEREPREQAPEPRQGRTTTSRIEDRWAEAAALLRARREGQAPQAMPAAGPPSAGEAPSAPVARPATPVAKPGAEGAAKPADKAEPTPTQSKKLVFRAAEPEQPAPAAAEDAPLPLWTPEPRVPASPPSRPAPTPSAPRAAQPPLPPRPRKEEPAPRPLVADPPVLRDGPKATVRPPLPPRPPVPRRKEEAQDPLSTPPIMMAEWDRFGDEDEAASRSAQRKKVAVRILAGVVGVAVVAGAAWVWTSTRGLPPYEARSTTLPRASIPPAGESASGVALASEMGAATPDTAVPPDSAAAPGTAGTPITAGTPGAPSRAAVPETRAPHQRYSWSMAAMGTMDAARSLVERLRRRAPDQAFAIAPIVSDGRTLYRVLGGLAADREELARIREPLGQATGQPAGTWLVREAPLAFSLQDFDDADGASAWVAELSRSGVPAYVLVVERDDGSRVHRVYAGAYADEAEAVTMRALIDSAGIRGAVLVERKGRVGG
ncbi:MAG TPA: SPOR domain-containing protein [Longimicrobiales bacterium]|nr:SPOR domain-containing protein [Longimicrobiales bacterium]